MASTGTLHAAHKADGTPSLEQGLAASHREPEGANKPTLDAATVFSTLHEILVVHTTLEEPEEAASTGLGMTKSIRDTTAVTMPKQGRFATPADEADKDTPRALGNGPQAPTKPGQLILTTIEEDCEEPEVPPDSDGDVVSADDKSSNGSGGAGDAAQAPDADTVDPTDLEALNRAPDDVVMRYRDRLFFRRGRDDGGLYLCLARLAYLGWLGFGKELPPLPGKQQGQRQRQQQEEEEGTKADEADGATTTPGRRAAGPRQKGQQLLRSITKPQAARDYVAAKMAAAASQGVTSLPFDSFWRCFNPDDGEGDGDGEGKQEGENGDDGNKEDGDEDNKWQR